MSLDQPPHEIRRLAEARRAARSERDWAEADRLRARIEAEGWRVVDRGRAFALHRAHPPDVEENGLLRYGASASVPSVLEEPPTLAVTVLRAVTDETRRVGTVIGAPDGIQRVLVANRPTAELPAGSPEVVLLNGWPGTAAALNAGLRRARGTVVIIADAGLDVPATALMALAAALDDPTVAVAGPWGLRTDDLRHWERAAPGDPEPAAIDGHLLAFRRADAIARGPLDEGFVNPFRLDVWLSLLLRDEGSDRPPRRAVVIDVGLNPVRSSDQAAGRTASGDSPVERRNYYRLIRRFGGARHLAQG